MKIKHINVIVYTSVFSIAYGGFYYQRYTSVPTAPVSQSIPESPANKTPKLTSQRIVPVTNAQNATQNYGNRIISNPHFKSALTDRSRISLHHKTKTASITLSTDTVNTYIAPLPSNKQTIYSRTGKNIRKVSQAFTSPAIFNSMPDNMTKNPSNTAKIMTAIDQSITVSDGSEFLPDGSSQQDLFVSQSKNPRVYTIKDYQTADISCNKSYGSTSPHAVLMRGLKGC